MESTNAKGGSKVIVWIIVVILILIGIWFAMQNNTEAPAVTPTPTPSVSQEEKPSERSMLEANVNDAVNFDNEASMKEVDKEFQ